MVHINGYCSELYFIESGLIRTYIINAKAQEVNIEFSLEGQFITAIPAFYNKTTSEVAMQALEETEVVCISYDALAELYEEFDAMNKLGRLITEENFVRREIWHTHRNISEGIDRYKSILKNNPELIQRIPLNHLASYLGMSKEHLSRLRAEI